MRDVYVIITLSGRVIARYNAFSEYDAAQKYEREIKERGEPVEPYQVMSRRDWVTWRTESEYDPYIDDVEATS